MGIGAGLAAFNRHTPTSVRTGQVERDVHIEEVSPEWRVVRGLGGGAGVGSQDLVRARPVKHEFSLEHLGVHVRLHTLADVGSRAVHPFPTTHSEVRCRTQRVGEGGVSAVNTRNREGGVCANNVVRALLPVGCQVTIGQVVAGQTLVSHDTDAVENRQGETWESIHPCGPHWTLGQSPP